jgi:glycosyltransferase involved in cell wall biosynthesis
MRVLFGMPDRGSLGGPNASEPPIVDGLRRLGVKVKEEVYVYGDSLSGTALLERIRRVLQTAHRLRRRVKAEQFDIIHLNTAFDLKALLRDTVTLSYLSFYKGKIFLKIHGSDAELLKTKNRLLRYLSRSLFFRVHGIGVISSEEQQNFIRAGVDSSKIFVVKYVVDKESYRTNPEFTKRLNIAADTPRLLFISRFIPAKGLIEVVRACNILRDRGYSFKLVCVGDGPSRPEAEEEVARLNLKEHVTFFGYIPEEETADFYANSSMLLLPTYHIEGFPMVILKSVAAGLPVITTRIRGAADYLKEPDNCLWVEPKNPEMLAEKIIYLLDHPELQKSIKENNYKLSEHFTAEVVAKEFIEIFKDL